jgi:hypothetical protein
MKILLLQMKFATKSLSIICSITIFNITQFVFSSLYLQQVIVE